MSIRCRRVTATWWTIEGVPGDDAQYPHPGRHWRGADSLTIDGTTAEMLALAAAIEKHSSRFEGSYCAVRMCCGDEVLIWSKAPHDRSTYSKVSWAEADDLAKQIRAVVGAATGDDNGTS